MSCQYTYGLVSTSPSHQLALVRIVESQSDRVDVPKYSAIGMLDRLVDSVH